MKMFKQIMSSDVYWKSVLRLGMLFIIVWSIIEYLGSYGFDMGAFKKYYINTGLFFTYVRSRLAGGLIYGMFTAFFLQRRKIIESRSR